MPGLPSMMVKIFHSKRLGGIGDFFPSTFTLLHVNSLVKKGKIGSTLLGPATSS